MMRARERVLRDKNISLFYGFVRLVAWDPVEGVLFLKNKAIDHYDDVLHDGQGGLRLLFPLLGDELALRVPLEIQTLHIADQNVLTKEYLSVSVNGTVKWRIVDLRKFYLLVSRELTLTADHSHPSSAGTTLTQGSRRESIGKEQNLPNETDVRVRSAIVWLRVLAEEQTRMVVSRVSSGLLMADRLASEMPELKSVATQDRSLLSALAANGAPTANSEWTGAADGLARSIYDALLPKVSQYGIHIEDCSLREIEMPPEIVEECIRAAKSAYLPLLAQREAAAKVAIKRAELAAEVELLGREAIGTREVVGAAPSFTLVDFLGDYLKKALNAPSQADVTRNITAVKHLKDLSDGDAGSQIQ